MAKGQGPKLRIKLKRKDGKQGTGTNRDGTTYDAMHVEFGVVWQNDRGMSVTLAPGFGITFNGKPIADSYINVFDAEQGGSKRSDDSDDEDF